MGAASSRDGWAKVTHAPTTYPDPYEATNPKHPEFVEALEERTEIEQ